jgi:hypothetical protein
MARGVERSPGVSVVVTGGRNLVTRSVDLLAYGGIREEAVLFGRRWTTNRIRGRRKVRRSLLDGP